MAGPSGAAVTGDRVVDHEQTAGTGDALALVLGGLALVDVGDQLVRVAEEFVGGQVEGTEIVDHRKREQVAIGHFQGRLPGQGAGQQAVLQCDRHGVLAGEAAGVVDREIWTSPCLQLLTAAAPRSPLTMRPYEANGPSTCRRPI
ncbi:hypothetical protein GCM10010317_091250 [Streptomyces mirabilis]|nr:hypothetical protein GCM10010317_091250 [Streptomyces mirabilis]